MAMATAVDRHQLDDVIAPAETGAVGVDEAPAVQKRRGWMKRMMYSSVAAVVAEKATATADAADDDGAMRTTNKPRRGGWLRRLMVPRHQHDALGRRRHRNKLGGGGAGSASSRLLAGLPRWKRVSIGGGWASALLDAATFRVMYVVEAVVLGLALSCFFCCCGCQI